MTHPTVVRVFTPLSSARLEGVSKILNEDRTSKSTKGGESTDIRSDNEGTKRRTKIRGTRSETRWVMGGHH